MLPTWPVFFGEVQSKFSIALPTTLPDLVAFIPMPIVEEDVMKSPTAMLPFSVPTHTGTRPAIDTGLGFSEGEKSPSSPYISFG